jgi:hypothetical protein
MSEQQSRRIETEHASRVDRLLGLIGNLSQHDPSPALRERLSALVAQRLNESARPAVHGSKRKPLVWLRPDFAGALLVAIGFTIALAIHFRRQEPARADRTTTETHSTVSRMYKAQVMPAIRPSVSRRHKIHHMQSAVAPSIGSEHMTTRLPYSNSAIETGTDTTIQIAMSQSELLSLGFPINTTVRDRRIVAELTLGGDGLPRAISVPLPLEVIKEKK